MDLTERFQLKRKCQDGDANDSYLDFCNSSIKRPFYGMECEKNFKTNVNAAALSHVIGWYPSLTASDLIKPSSLPLKDEMVASMENGMQLDTDNNSTKIADNVRAPDSCILQGSFAPPDPHTDVAMDLPASYGSSHALEVEVSENQQSLIETPGCSECLAGKSGHIHHIGRWKLIDSPKGFCQL